MGKFSRVIPGDALPEARLVASQQGVSVDQSGEERGAQTSRREAALARLVGRRLDLVHK